MTESESHIRLLSILYFVLAGVQALFGCIPIIHVVMGGAIMSGAWNIPPPPVAAGTDTEVAAQQLADTAQAMNMVGGLFLVIGLLSICFAWAFAAMFAYAGWSLRERKRYTFCLVAAGFACLMFPIGTALGVVTFILLLKPQARTLFHGEDAYDSYDAPRA